MSILHFLSLDLLRSFFPTTICKLLILLLFHHILNFPCNGRSWVSLLTYMRIAVPAMIYILYTTKQKDPWLSYHCPFKGLTLREIDDMHPNNIPVSLSIIFGGAKHSYVSMQKCLLGLPWILPAKINCCWPVVSFGCLWQNEPTTVIDVITNSTWWTLWCHKHCLQSVLSKVQGWVEQYNDFKKIKLSRFFVQSDTELQKS